jgi:large subunit ribosomal protein L22
MKASLTNYGQPPRKVNLLAGLVRGKKVDEAITVLNFTDKKASKSIVKIIQSAAANAINNFNAKREDLVVKEITVNKGIVLKRSMPRARGSAFLIRRRASHIAVVLGGANLEVSQAVKVEEATASAKAPAVKGSKTSTKKTTKAKKTTK